MGDKYAFKLFGINRNRICTHLNLSAPSGAWGDSKWLPFDSSANQNAVFILSYVKGDNEKLYSVFPSKMYYIV